MANTDQRCLQINDLTYSKLIDLLKKNKIETDRKVLADLANQSPASFSNLIAQIKK